MSEYIIYENDPIETTDYLGVKHSVSHYEKREQITRCRDCKHLISYPDASYCTRTSAFIGVSDEDFCAWAERRDA